MLRSFAAFAAFATPLLAQCPNDECVNAIIVGVGVSGPYDTTCATTSAPAWPCGAGGSDLWFSYTHTGPSGPVNANTCTPARTYDTTLEVFDGGCTALNSLGCNDDACSLGSQVSFNAVQNTTYLIRIGGFRGAAGTTELNIAAAVACPPADECTSALVANVGQNGPYSNSCATTSAPTWPCGAGGNDLWFVYRHDGWDATVTANTCSGSTFDTTLEAFSGTCTSLTSLACNDDSCGARSQISWSATQGTTYYIRVGGFRGARGDFVLEIKIAGAFTSVGTGCGGTGLTGSSSAGSGLPEIGSTVTMTLAPAAGAAQAIWLGVPQAPVAFCPGCNLCTTFTVLLPAGSVAAVPIPNSGALCGACVSFQGSSVFVPAGAGCSLGGLSFTLSNCVTVLIGC